MKVKNESGVWKDGKVKLKVAGVWKDQSKSFTKVDGQWRAEVGGVNGDLKYEGVFGVGVETTYNNSQYGYRATPVVGSASQTILLGGTISHFFIGNYTIPAYRMLYLSLIGNAVSQLNNVTEINVNGIKGVVDLGSVSYNYGYTTGYIVLESAPPLSGQWEVKIYGK